MPTIERNAILPYPREQMFRLVEDFARYPAFLPGCVGAEVLSRGEDSLRARLELAVFGRRYQVVTRNRWQHPERIDLELEEGPFHHLSGCWRFHALGAQGCRVELALDCEPKGLLLGRLFGSMAGRAADRVMAAMCREARKQYG